MMNAKQGIGVFDSGIGGLTIWHEIVRLLPQEHTIYLADSKNAPYGQRSKQEIVDLSVKNTELLLQKGCKLIVVACNTATTNAIAYLRANYKVPFVGIEPAIKPAALQTTTNSIGVLATKGTLTSALFYETSQKYLAGIKVTERIGEGLVPLIESGKINSPEMTIQLKKALNPMLNENIDTLVLGCSHYPFLIPNIIKIIGKKVKIIDSGLAVAKQTKAILEKNQLLNLDEQQGSHHLYSNKDKAMMEQILKNFNLDNYSVDYLDF